MAETERKYKGSMTLGKLEVAFEAHEQLFGGLKKLEALLGVTIATYDSSDFPTQDSLSLVQRIGGQAPQTPAGATHLFDGDVVVVGAPCPVSVYRTS